jgi:hypothetical protein
MIWKSFAFRHYAWSLFLAIAACSMLMLLAQFAAWYLSTMILSKIANGTFAFSSTFTISPSIENTFSLLSILFFVVVLLCPLLICGSSAFLATKGLSPVQARKKGLIFGAYSGIGYTFLLISLLIGCLLWEYQLDHQRYIQCGNHTCGSWFGFGWNLLISFLPFVVGYALAILLIAPLAGWLGSLLRSRFPRRDQQRSHEFSRNAVIIALSLSWFLMILLCVGMYFLKSSGWLSPIWDATVAPFLFLREVGFATVIVLV